MNVLILQLYDGIYRAVKCLTMIEKNDGSAIMSYSSVMSVLRVGVEYST